MQHQKLSNGVNPKTKFLTISLVLILGAVLLSGAGCGKKAPEAPAPTEEKTPVEGGPSAGPVCLSNQEMEKLLCISWPAPWYEHHCGPYNVEIEGNGCDGFLMGLNREDADGMLTFTFWDRQTSQKAVQFLEDLKTGIPNNLLSWQKTTYKGNPAYVADDPDYPGSSFLIFSANRFVAQVQLSDITLERAESALGHLRIYNYESVE